MDPITHFTHPGHQLHEMDENNEYQCNGCKTNGIGKRYRCHSCNFDLHEYCANCPDAMPSFMDPEHDLELVTLEVGRVCNVCGDFIEGIFYKCKSHKFYVHPLCTQLPQFVRHTLHSRTDHPPLELMPPPPSLPTFCLVCGVSCSLWRYRCAICSIDIHVPCVLASPYMSRTVPPPNQQHPPPPPGHPPSYGAYAGPSVPPPNQQHPPPPGHPPSYGAYAGPWIPPGYPPDYGPYTSAPPGHPPSYGAYAGPLVPPPGYPPPSGYGSYAGPLVPPPGYPPPSGYGSYAGTSAPPPYQPHPPSPAYAAYAYGVPFGAAPYYYMHHQYQPPPYHNVHMPPAQGGGGGGGGGWKPNNMMFTIVGNLILGVLGNAVFGALQDLV